jgi:hypothetical protein
MTESLTPRELAERRQSFTDLRNEPAAPVVVPVYGDPQEISVGELRVGDFVVEIPTQGHVLGHRFMSAVTRAESRWDVYKMSTGYRRPKVSVTSKFLTFASHPHGYHYPDSFTVTVRRPILEG